MISVKDLKKTYSAGAGSAEEVLHGVSFDLPETGFVCILGRSGSGKTSLLNAIGGLDVFDSGSVEIDGTEVSSSDYSQMEKLRNSKFKNFLDAEKRNLEINNAKPEQKSEENRKVVIIRIQ